MEVECKHYNHFMDHSSIKCNSYQIDTVPVSISSMQHCQTSYPPQGCNCLRSITFSFHTGIFPCQDAPTIYISQSIHPWCQCPGDPVDWSAFLDNSWTHGRHWEAIIGQLTKGRHVYNLSWRYSCFSSPCTWEWGFLGVMCTYVSAFSWMSVSDNGVECANYHTFQKDVDVCKLPWQLQVVINTWGLPVCYGPTHWDYISMDLTNFSLFFILSDHFRLQTMKSLPMGTHLSHALHHFTKHMFASWQTLFYQI